MKPSSAPKKKPGPLPATYQVELATDIIYTADEAGRFVHFNPHAHTILGYSKEELLGRPYLDLVRPEFRESVRKYYGRQFVKRIHNTYREIPCIAQDGSTVWLGQNVQLLIEDGRILGFQAVARDVTRRVLDEMLATRLAAVLEMVAKGAPLAESLEKLCHTVEELSHDLRCSILLLENGRLHHGAAPSLPAPYIAAVEALHLPIGPLAGSCGTAAYLGRTVVVTDIANDPRWSAFGNLATAHGLLSCWAVPVFSSDRAVLGTFSVYHSTTRGPASEEMELVQRCTHLAGVVIERARHEMEVKRLNEELEQRVRDRTAELEKTNVLLETEIAERRRTEQQLLQAKSLESVGRLAGGVAHEFNNWLTVILLYTEQLAEDLPESDPRRQGVEEIRRAADRASSLTRQLLAFGRKQVLQPKPLDLNVLLSNLSNVLRSIMGPQVRLRMDLTPFLGTVKADPAQMEQVLVNLALNARDAMPAGGTFTLRTSNVAVTAQGHLYEAGLAPGEYALFEAIDSGIGMDAATQEHIFEPFFSTKGAGAGSGLGLATVYGVIRQSGGQILVRSAPGKGAAFQIFLPLYTGHDESAAVPAAPAMEPDLSIQRVVVVDDDATIRSLVCQALARLGCDVVEAPDPIEALELCRDPATQVDLLLTDVVMPNLSGRELAVRAVAARPGLKVLFISAYANSELDPGLRADLGCDYLAKPFTKEQLAAKVRKLCESENRALRTAGGK